MTTRLTSIGDSLEAAATRDLRVARRRRVRRRRLGGLAAVLVIAVPGGALAAGLLTTEDVARSLPAGTQMLVGSNPTCEVVREGVEYRCTLPDPVHGEVADLMGTVEPTVDATKHVNGGCRSLRSDGREWRCYIGKAAIDAQIIGPHYLGAYAPSPAVG